MIETNLNQTKNNFIYIHRLILILKPIHGSRWKNTRRSWIKGSSMKTNIWKLVWCFLNLIGSFKGIDHQQTILWLSHKRITPMTSYLFTVNIRPAFANYSLRAWLRFMNFTRLEWTVWIKRFLRLILNL